MSAPTRLVWSTAGTAGWADLVPVNDPTFSDGRLFLLAVSRSREYSPTYLVCLNAEQGSVLWKRELVTNHTTLLAPRRIAESAAVSRGRHVALRQRGYGLSWDGLLPDEHGSPRPGLRSRARWVDRMGADLSTGSGLGGPVPTRFAAAGCRRSAPCSCHAMLPSRSPSNR